jgi:hypothetical protein
VIDGYWTYWNPGWRPGAWYFVRHWPSGLPGWDRVKDLVNIECAENMKPRTAPRWKRADLFCVRKPR